MNDSKPGILVINVLHYTGEWMGTTEGTKYLVPFATSSRTLVEKLVEIFNRVREINDEEYETDMEILSADTIKRSPSTDAVQRRDSTPSVVDIVVSSKTITAAQAKELETRIQDPVYDNMDTYVLNYKLEALFDEYWGRYKNQIGHPSYQGTDPATTVYTQENKKDES